MVVPNSKLPKVTWNLIDLKDEARDIYLSTMKLLFICTLPYTFYLQVFKIYFNRLFSQYWKFVLLVITAMNLIFHIKNIPNLFLNSTLGFSPLSWEFSTFFFFLRQWRDVHIGIVSCSSLYDKFRQAEDVNLLIIPPVSATKIGW